MGVRQRKINCRNKYFACIYSLIPLLVYVTADMQYGSAAFTLSINSLHCESINTNQINAYLR
jgi:hypothetical protein